MRKIYRKWGLSPPWTTIFFLDIFNLSDGLCSNIHSEKISGIYPYFLKALDEDETSQKRQFI